MKFKILTASIIFIFFTGTILAQVYGLAFSGHDENKDKRTGLNLTPNGALEFSDEFELSFELSFTPNKIDYFGYIVRVIMDDQLNFDLIHNIGDNFQKDFTLVVGSKPTAINFNLPTENFFDTWKTFRMVFKLQNDEILFYINDAVFSQKNVGLRKNGKFRIMFGMNNSTLFKTTDVPSMRIKNVKIDQKHQTVFSWLLNEKAGSNVSDEVSGQMGIAVNPQWIGARHSIWEKQHEINMKGLVKVAFNPLTETLYFLGSDSMIIDTYGKKDLSFIQYAIPEKSITTYQYIFDNINSRLYKYSIDEHFATYFNFEKKAWMNESPGKIPETNFWHHTKMISGSDSALYIFGGYGHHKYKNVVQKLDLKKNKWEVVKTVGDILSPRYLAAMGKNVAGDSVYILGGFGSKSGEQILKPENYYDLFAYSIKNKQFKKVFELKPLKDDFCFANSLIIDQEHHNYYGLTFPQNEFNCKLQLIQGSLNGGKYKLVGNEIPFKFYDVRSYSDLFYCPASKILLAVTIYCDDQNISHIEVHTINFPPNIAESIVSIVANKHHRTYIYLILFVVLAFLVLILIFKLFIHSRLSESALEIDKIAQPVNFELSNEKEISIQFSQQKSLNHKNSILVFGDLQVFNKDGVDITKKFSPLIRELFLLILLNSIKSNKGISVEKLDEILWFDKDDKSARNNRAVSIAKLKEHIFELDGWHLTNNGGYWKIEISPDLLYFDYQCVLNLINHAPLKKETVGVLLNIIETGGLLTSLTYLWLDDFKSQISNAIIDELHSYSASIDSCVDAVFLIRIADAIVRLDVVNEEAMLLKCKALTSLGKHSLAKQTYLRFVNEYKSIYDEEYKKSFESIFKI